MGKNINKKKLLFALHVTLIACLALGICYFFIKLLWPSPATFVFEGEVDLNQEVSHNITVTDGIFYMNLSNIKLNNQAGKLFIPGFKGKLIINGTQASLVGTADEVFLNEESTIQNASFVINLKQGTIEYEGPLQFTALKGKFNLLRPGVETIATSLGSFSLTSFTGNILVYNNVEVEGDFTALTFVGSGMTINAYSN